VAARRLEARRVVTTTRRRPLKIYPEPEVMLEQLVRALERIADEVGSVVETLDALVVVDEHGRKCLRTDKP
jgi:hypothetical protein